ncbi:MAG: hypothetical protein HOL29_08895, partial [Euryarchaeota archaeon]|nr:hypothetical protein [Euryarchaeota archaeon]
FSTANGGILDVKTDKFFIGNLTEQYISGSDGNIEISSSIFHLDPKANGGDGSLIIGANATILSDLTVENIRTPAQIDGIASTEANASSSIKADGFARFVSASIGGWGITTSSIEGGNLIMKPEGILQTRDFASGLKGWKISSEGNGTAEFENVRIRGTLRTTTFEKESVNAVGGQLWVANSTTITGSVTDTETTMSVKNASGFSAGEILLIKKVDNTGFQTEYVLLNSASLDSDGSNEDETYGRIMVQRAYGSGTQGDFVGDLASSAQAYEDGQVIVSTGKLNTGYIKMNANPNDVNTPYMDIVERTGSGLYDVALKVRLGDLSGLANSDYVFGDSTPGFGLATDNVFLQGGIIAKTGSIGGIKMDDGKLFTGNGVYGNANTGFYVDSGSKFALGSKLLWNPSTETLTIRGSLQFADGTDVEGAVDAASNSSVARTVELSADKYVVTFDEFGNEAPSNQTITLTATPQNFTGDVYYEFYKDASIQGSRSTTNTFTVDTALEKPTSSTPKTYEVRAFTGSSGGTAASTDSLTLFGLQPGSDGVAGVDAVTAFLTNEAHTFAAANNGDIVSFNGAFTDMEVFEGVTNTTSDYTITKSDGTGVTSTLSTNRVTISAMSHDSGSVDITATSGSTTLTKTMSLVKSKEGAQGLAGANAKTLSVTADSQIFTFSSASNTTVPDDNTIEFFFSQQNLSGTIGDTDIVVTDVAGNVITSNPTLSPSSLSGGTGVVSGSYVFATNLANDSGKFPCTVTVTKDGLTDSFKVFAISGGTDGVSSLQYLLSNEAHIVPASSAGVVSSYSNSNTEIHVYEGTTALSYDGVGTSNGTWKVDTPIVSPSGKITVGTLVDQGDYLLVKNHSAMDNSTDSVTISYPIVGKTTDGTSFSFTKTQTITKSKEGISGASASLISLTSDSQVFTFASSSVTTPDDNTIELFINQQNLSGTITASDITILDQQSNSHTVPTFAPSSLTDGTGVVSGSLVFGTNTPTNKLKFPITISVTKDGVTDSTKIFTLDGGSDGSDGTAGADAYTVFLTNESHTFPAAADGTVDSSNLAAGATDVVVFKGTTQLTNDNNSPYDTNTYRATAAVSGITMGSTKTNNQRRFTPTAVTSDTGTATITITDNTTGTVFTKTYTFSKSKEGAQGNAGADNQDFSFLDAGISSVTGYLEAGLRFNSDVVGFHKEIAQGATATLSDFTSFLDSSGNFYLGGNSGGMSGSAATSGYLAWNNTNRSLLISGSNATIEVDKFLLGSGTSQYISGSNGNVEIAGDVTFRGRPDNGDGNVVFFDDFSQYAGAGAVDGGDYPKNDGTGDAWWFAKKPEVALVSDSDCISGQALQVGNNALDDEANFFSNQLIPFNESSLYEIEVRIKRTGGTSNTKAYVGISGMKPDGTTKVGYNGTDNTTGHYVTLQSHNLGDGNGTGNFQIFKGYLKGTGTDHHLHNSKTDPANARVEILNGYIRAYFLLNYDNQPGRVLVDYIKIKEFASGGTSRISGDSITTGVLKSNNLSGTVGSQFKLDDGTFKLGGTTSPKLEWDGSTLSVTGNITVSNPGDFADPSLVNDFPDSSNLYVHYPLHGKVISNNGYDRILDFSGNERHGDDTEDGIQGGAVAFHSGSATGPLPGAIQFGGYGSRVELNTLAQGLTNNMNISLSFWIKKTDTYQGAVFGIHDGGGNDLVFFVDHSNVANQVKLICGNDLGVINTGVEFTNTWRHIGLVMDNGQVGKLYIDGVFIGNFPTS